MHHRVVGPHDCFVMNCRRSSIITESTWQLRTQEELDDAAGMAALMDGLLADVLARGTDDLIMYGNGQAQRTWDAARRHIMDTGRPATPLLDPRWASAFLDQGETWRPAQGSSFVKIADMTPVHALNAAAWLLDNALLIGLTVAVGAVTAEHPEPQVLRGVGGDPLSAARAAMLEAPLFAALLIRASEYARESTPPWAAKP